MQILHIETSRYGSGSLVMTYDSTGFSFVPDSAILIGDSVRVTVDSTLADVYGNLVDTTATIDFIVITKEWP